MTIILTLGQIRGHFSNPSQSNEHFPQLNQSDVLLLYHRDQSNDLDHIGKKQNLGGFFKIFFSISRSERLCDDTLTTEIFKDMEETKEKGKSLSQIFDLHELWVDSGYQDAGRTACLLEEFAR